FLSVLWTSDPQSFQGARNLSYLSSPRHAAFGQGFGRVLYTQEVLAQDRMNCVRDFSVSHYFAELD
ncbi:MAG TPA: hypothetical protein VFS68_01030, partial [Candidatus Udaeobacter sp.]|nr:hypothetical protein [Candidatus Udaeobacter sp.]